MLQVDQQILKKTGWNYQLYSWFSIAPFDGTNNFSLHVETQKRALLSTDTPPNANDFEGGAPGIQKNEASWSDMFRRMAFKDGWARDDLEVKH